MAYSRALSLSFVVTLSLSRAASASPPGAAQPSRANPPVVMTHPGFRMLPDGSSIVFVFASAPPRFDVHTDARRTEVRVHHARLGVANDHQALETRFFETPVTRARLERRGTDAVLVCELRGASAPSVTTEPGPDGRVVLVAHFAPGSYRTEAERRAVAGEGGAWAAPPMPATPNAPTPGAAAPTTAIHVYTPSSNGEAPSPVGATTEPSPAPAAAPTQTSSPTRARPAPSSPSTSNGAAPSSPSRPNAPATSPPPATRDNERPPAVDDRERPPPVRRH